VLLAYCPRVVADSFFWVVFRFRYFLLLATCVPAMAGRSKGFLILFLSRILIAHWLRPIQYGSISDAGIDHFDLYMARSPTGHARGRNLPAVPAIKMLNKGSAASPGTTAEEA
jgi:hypothetical protein